MTYYTHIDYKAAEMLEKQRMPFEELDCQVDNEYWDTFLY